MAKINQMVSETPSARAGAGRDYNLRQEHKAGADRRRAEEVAVRPTSRQVATPAEDRDQTGRCTRSILFISSPQTRQMQLLQRERDGVIQRAIPHVQASGVVHSLPWAHQQL